MRHHRSTTTHGRQQLKTRRSTLGASREERMMSCSVSNRSCSSSTRRITRKQYRPNNNNNNDNNDMAIPSSITTTSRRSHNDSSKRDPPPKKRQGRKTTATMTTTAPGIKLSRSESWRRKLRQPWKTSQKTATPTTAAAAAVAKRKKPRALVEKIELVAMKNETNQQPFVRILVSKSVSKHTTGIQRTNSSSSSSSSKRDRSMLLLLKRKSRDDRESPPESRDDEHEPIVVVATAPPLENAVVVRPEDAVVDTNDKDKQKLPTIMPTPSGQLELCGNLDQVLRFGSSGCPLGGGQGRNDESPALPDDADAVAVATIEQDEKRSEEEEFEPEVHHKTKAPSRMRFFLTRKQNKNQLTLQEDTTPEDTATTKNKKHVIRLLRRIRHAKSSDQQVCFVEENGTKDRDQDEARRDEHDDDDHHSISTKGSQTSGKTTEDGFLDMILSPFSSNHPHSIGVSIDVEDDDDENDSFVEELYYDDIYMMMGGACADDVFSKDTTLLVDAVDARKGNTIEGTFFSGFENAFGFGKKAPDIRDLRIIDSGLSEYYSSEEEEDDESSFLICKKVSSSRKKKQR